MIAAYWESRPPAVKLAVAYALILAIISAAFSIALYQFADHQLIEGLRHQYNRYNGPPAFVPGGSPSRFDLSMVQAELDSGRRHLIMQLVYFNVFILAIGSAASYLLAKRTVKPIEEALEAQTRFTADASHELRTPLAVMRAEIEVARADPKITKSDALQLLDSNLEEVNKLNNLAEALLRLARSDAQPIDLVPAAVEEIAEDAVGRVSGKARAKKIEIINDTTELQVLADPHSLAELIAILLENAIKYSKKGQNVTLSSRVKGHYGYITVSDEGRGIKNEDLPRIFERFYRADTSRTSMDVEGHGLGLSIAQKIAEVHGAEITVISEHGKGSTFSVKLPISASQV